MSGQVMLCFDDGLAIHVNAARVLAQHKLRGTFGAVPGRAGKPGFLDETDMRYLALAGHCVCNHSMNHLWLGQGQEKPGLARHIKEEITADCLAAREWLNARGFAGDYYMAPYGTANVDGVEHIRLLLAAGVKWVRLTVGAPMAADGWTPDGGKRLYPLGYAGKLVGISAAIDIRWPGAVKDSVEAAADADALSILVFHNVSHVAGNAQDVAWEAFEAEIERIGAMVEDGRLVCVTPTDLVPPV